MNDLIPAVKITGEVDFHGQDLYDSKVDPTWLRKRIGMVFQKANPFPMSIYDNVAYGPRTHGIRNKAKLDEIVENSLRSAAIWDEVKDRLKKERTGAFRRPAAAAVHRTGAGRGAGGAADGRVHQRTGPHFHLQDRGSVPWS